MTERGERVDDRLEADTGASDARKDAAKMVEANGTTWGRSPSESEEMQIEALKEAYEE